MQKKSPLVSVVVVSYNGKHFLKDCFDSLLASHYPKSSMEILLVDNCSHDDSVEYVRKNYPKIKIIKNDVNNYCKANNLGIRRSRGEYVAFLNNDTKVDRNWLTELMKVIIKDEKVGAVGSKILYPDGRIQNAGHYELPNFYWGERGAFQESKAYSKAEEVVSLCGAAVLYRKKCFREAGLFDEDYVMYNEDVDMILRIRRKGWIPLFVPKSIVYHRFHGSGNHELSRFYIERNRLLFIAKFYPEKLSNALIGNKYFTVENNLHYCGMIYSFLLDIVIKLLKHHRVGMINNVLKEIFEELKRISNYENEILKLKIQEVNNQLNNLNTAFIHQQEELSSRAKHLLQKEQENAAFQDQLNTLNLQLSHQQEELSSRAKHLLQKEQENAAFQDQLNTLNLQLSHQQEELSSRAKHLLQKEQENAAFQDQLNTLNLQLSHQQEELSSRAKHLLQKEQENAAFQDQLNTLNLQLSHQQEELSSRAKHLLQKEQENAAFQDQINTLNLAFKRQQQELTGIYNSEGFKYILRPLWTVLWNTKQVIKTISFKIHRILLLTSAIALAPVFMVLTLFFLLEYLLWKFSGLIPARKTNQRNPALPEQFKVSIVIPSFNGMKYLKTCLQSISVANGFQDNSGNEVIVVDDGSTDGSVEYVKANFPNAKIVINKKNMGFGYACNRGVREAKNALIILLNNDVILTENFLPPLMRHFKDENVFAVYPKIYGWDKNTFAHGMNMGEIRDGYVWLWNESDTQNKDKVYQASPSIYAIGGMMAFRRDDFLWLGAFDDIYKPYCWEDIDICYRAWKRGLTVLYEPESIAYHKGHATIGSYKRHIEIKNEILFIWKNISDEQILMQHFNLLSWNMSRFGGSFLMGFLWALNQLPRVIAQRFQERKYTKVKDRTIFDSCAEYYRNFMHNNFRHVQDKRVKNILCISHFKGKMTGAETGLLNIIKYLDREKYKSVVVCPSRGTFTEALDKMGIEVICLDFPVLSGALDNQYDLREVYNFIRGTLRAAGDLSQIIKKKEINLVHSNVSVFLVGALAARLNGIPHIWHVKEIIPPGPWRKLFSIFIPLLSAEVIPVSYASRENFTGKKCAVIYDGVDLKLFLDRKRDKLLSEKLDLEESVLTVGFIGSIISWKGVHIFLKAASEVVKSFPRVQFVVAGDLAADPQYSRKVQEFVQLRNLESKVKFVGFQEDVPRFLSLLDIVVVPSRRPDPGPNAVMEAMAMAKAVVASDTGGIPEIIKEGESGFLFPSGDWELLYKILISLLQDDKLRMAIGIAAQKRVSEKFSASVMTEKIQRIYGKLLGSHICDSVAKESVEEADISELKENRHVAQGRWMTDRLLYAECSSFCVQAYLEKERARKKNILIVTPELPYPLDRGGNIRIFTHIKMLSQKYNICLLSFVHEENENQYIPMLQEFCKKVSTVAFPISSQPQAPLIGYRFLPETIRSCYSEELKSNLMEIISAEKIDLVQIDSIFMSFYVNCFGNSMPAILIEHDIDALSFRKSYLWSIRNAGFWSRFVELERLSRFEKRICKKFHRVITLSERDKQKLERLTGVSNAAVVPTGVDIDFFRSHSETPPGASNGIIFVGYMGHYPNEDGLLYFYNQIFPFIRKEIPDIKLYVVGSHPTKHIYDLKTDKNVVVTGFVQDIRKYLRKCSVFVAPLRLGGGIRGKILEAMAMGIPVISTSTGCNGIEVTPGEHIIVADEPREFARQTIRMLKDEDLRRKLAKNARALVEEKYNWQKTVDQLDEIYAFTINKFKNDSAKLINEY